MRKAQGSLEYLIIIAAVLIVAGVTIVMVTGSTGSSKQSVMYSSCQEAAVQCRMLRAADPTNPCTACETQCVDPSTGIELFDGVIDCCKAGASGSIYEGATECEGYGLCTPGSTKACKIGDCDGIRTCSEEGEWGECVETYCPPPVTDCDPEGDGSECVVIECKDASCNAEGRCEHSDQEDGTSCDPSKGGVCVSGECGCLEDSDCRIFETGSDSCVTQKCVSNACVSSEITECSGEVSDGCCPAGCNNAPEHSDYDTDCPSKCGNEIIESGENCEPDVAFSETCTDVGYNYGTLSCENDCRWDVTECGTVNVDACKSMSSGNNRDQCFINIASITGDCSFCAENPQWSSTTNKNTCYYEAAMTSSDYSCCAGAGVSTTRDLCYIDVAKLSSSCAGCGSNPQWSSTTNKNTCYYEGGTRSSDYSCCAGAGVSTTRDLCYIDVAKVTDCTGCPTNPSWSSVNNKDDCYYWGGIASCNVTCCNSISSSTKKNNCLSEVVFC